MSRGDSLWALAAGGMATLAAAMGIGRFVYTPILPAMMESLGFSEAEAGFVASANFAGYLVGALLAATSLLAGSRRNWLLGALAASALTTGAMGLFSGMFWFVLLRFVGGLASALALVFSSALVLERLALAGRGSLSAVHFAGVGVGIILSALTVSGLLAAGADWRALWYASGLLSAAALVAVLMLVSDTGDAVPPTPADAGRAHPGLKFLVIAYGLFGFGYVITATFLVAIVRASPSAAAVEPAVWLAVGLAVVPSVALWLRVGRRVGVPLAFALACVVESVGVAASVLWPSTVGVLVAAVLLGGTFMGLTALGLVCARQLSSGDPRRTLALVTASFGVGQIAGPSFAGVLHALSGSFVLPSLVASCALLVAALLVATRLAPTGP